MKGQAFNIKDEARMRMIAPPAPKQSGISGKPRVIDGDTIEIAGKKFRLHGIDAPEAKQTCTVNGQPWRCGWEATNALAFETAYQWARCDQKDVDRYGRIIAVCYVGPYDLGVRMVRAGWALAYRKYSMDYVDEEANAKADMVGMWRGEFVTPWEWRRSR